MRLDDDWNARGELADRLVDLIRLTRPDLQPKRLSEQLRIRPQPRDQIAGVRPDLTWVDATQPPQVSSARHVLDLVDRCAADAGLTRAHGQPPESPGRRHCRPRGLSVQGRPKSGGRPRPLRCSPTGCWPPSASSGEEGALLPPACDAACGSADKGLL